MSGYSWSCLACRASQKADDNHCRLCGCPAESTVRQQEAHRAAYMSGKPLPPPRLPIPFINNVATLDAFRSFVFAPFIFWLGLKFISEGTATFVFGRHATHMLEVTGQWSSLLGALSLILCSIAMGSIVADYFDKRENEQLYKRILQWSLHGWAIFFIAACIVGWKLEVIRWTPIN